MNTQIPYTKREIDEHFNGIKDTLKRIESQTTKTNGRVSALEGWRSVLLGAWFVTFVFVIPVITYIYHEQIQDLENAVTANTQAIQLH